MIKRSTFGLAILLFVTASAALADGSQTGTISGMVADGQGSPLPGVQVVLTSPRGEQSTFSDEAGTYRFALLQPGEYSVKASLEGFGDTARTVQLEAGARKSLDLPLGVALSETIAVTAEAPLVDKYEVSTGATLTAEIAEEVVFTNRTSQSLLTALPGVVQDDVSQQLGDSRPSMNGGMWQEAAAFVDGVDTSNTRRGGGSRIILPVTSLAEASADGSGYTAEYGRAVGGVTGMVTKSGTNSFHGDLLWVAQNQDWTAQSDNVPLERDNDLVNSFEASVGGPIVRDKAWFFAAAAENSSNELTALAGGDLLDNSLTTESRILKVNVSPAERHSLSLTGIDAPGDVPFFAPTYAEVLAVSNHALGGDFITVNWNWSVSSNVFLETRFATQDSSESRVELALNDVDPNASPDDPAGNTAAYWDLTSALRWHGTALPLGPGELNFPRDQFNVAANWFRGNHDIRGGLDYQDVAWETVNRPPDRYLGRNYDPSLPGGFATPNQKRVFVSIDSPVETASTVGALFVQDRLTVGDRWTITAGLRLEDQDHENDIGQTVIESTDLAPRLAAVYDLGGGGEFLLKGTLGRYYTMVPQDIVNDNFTTSPNGANAWDQFAWNPATQRYDVFQTRVLPSATDIVFDGIDPYYKDEATFGFEWQVRPRWAFTARGIWWQIDDIFTETLQFDSTGGVVSVVDNLPEAEREYLGLQLQLNRQFANGWTLRSNYTWGEGEGNVFGNTHFVSSADNFLEGRAVIDPDFGIPVTAVNRYGPAPQDRTHILNVTGAKRWNLGNHDFVLGGLFWFRSGAPWNFDEAVTLGPVVPGGATINSTFFSEPRGSRELDSIYNLNVAGTWEFPIYEQLRGSLRAEIANLTDEQEQISINSRTGNPIPVRTSWQKPRELRLVVGVTF